MNSKVYAQPYSSFQVVQNAFYRYFEYLLLFFIALIGLVCSAFALADNYNHPNNNYTKKVSNFEPQSANNVDNFLSISGPMEKNKPILISVKLDLSSHRYILDMGDGKKVILTQSPFEYLYQSKGQFVIELKEIKRGLISSLGEKKLEIL
jgi:hypothetical protein